MTWHTVDGGGGYSFGGGFELDGTVGQPDAGVMTGRSFELVGGFWSPSVTVVVFGDCDRDGHVDLGDLTDMAACLSGLDGGLAPGCECLDADLDKDADLGDFAAFQENFSGS